MQRLVFASLLLASATTSAIAEEPTQERPVAVSFTGLNLDSEQDAAAFYSRLQVAASRACDVPEAQSATMRRAIEACRQDALDRAVSATDHPTLTRLHAANAR